MSKPLVKIARIAFVLSLASLAAVGCGRKGDLDRPSTPVEQQNIRKNTKASENKTEPVAERPFLLDPLL
jgi:predicted small lipoprotein YifL